MLKRLYYETEGMSHIRQLLNDDGVTNAKVDLFKDVLIRLEHKGFQLVKKANKP